MLKKVSSNAVTLMAGTVTSQAIAVVSSLVLTRLFSHEQFGVFGLFLSVVAILSSAASGRYEQAILIPEKDKDAYALLVLSCILGFLFSFGFIIIVFALFLDAWYYIAAIAVFFTVAMTAFSVWHNRMRHYRLMATSRILMTSTVAVISIGMGAAGFESWGLLVGSLIGTCLSAALLFAYTPHIADPDIVMVARRFIRFPKFLIAAHLLNAVCQRLPILLLAPMFGLVSVGLFVLTQRVVGLPSQIVASAIGEVFRRKASEDLRNSGECRATYISTLRSLAAISLATFVPFFFLAPVVFELVFGLEWRAAGEMAQILTPMVAAQFIASPLSAMFMLAERQKMDIVWQIGLFVAVAAAFGIGYLTHSEFVTIILFSSAYTVMYLVNLMMTYRFACGK